MTIINGYTIGDDDTRHYLSEHGYKTVEEWAADSDYHYNKNTGVWSNDDGDPVDIHLQLLHTIAERLNNHE